VRGAIFRDTKNMGIQMKPDRSKARQSSLYRENRSASYTDEFMIGVHLRSCKRYTLNKEYLMTRAKECFWTSKPIQVLILNICLGSAVYRKVSQNRKAGYKLGRNVELKLTNK